VPPHSGRRAPTVQGTRQKRPRLLHQSAGSRCRTAARCESTSAPPSLVLRHRRARGNSCEHPAAKYRPGRPGTTDALSRTSARAHDLTRETAGTCTRTGRPWKLPRRRATDVSEIVDWDDPCRQRSCQGGCAEGAKGAGGTPHTTRPMVHGRATISSYSTDNSLARGATRPHHQDLDVDSQLPAQQRCARLGLFAL